MTDAVGLRLAIVIVVALLLLALWLVMRRPRPLKRLTTTELALGIHLFSATRCRGCEELRRDLEEAVGDANFVEHPEETEGALFETAGIDLVPVVVTVIAPDRAEVWKGVPPRRVLERAVPRQ